MGFVKADDSASGEADLVDCAGRDHGVLSFDLCNGVMHGVAGCNIPSNETVNYVKLLG